MTQRREYRYVNLEIEIERVFVLIRRPTPCLPPPPPPQKESLILQTQLTARH